MRLPGSLVSLTNWNRESMRCLCLIVGMLMAAVSAFAQNAFFESKPDTVIRKPQHDVCLQAAFGWSNVLDTYLSNETFRGVGGKILYEKVRNRREKPLVYTFHSELSFYSSDSRGGVRRDLSLNYNYVFATQYRWDCLADRLHLRAGGYAEALLGGSYNLHNTGNNPAQARVNLNLGAMLSADYSFTLWRLPMRVSYEMRLPFAGLMFSPRYKQSYYEIFMLGDYDRNVVFTTVAPLQIWQQLAVDFRVGTSTAVRLSYISDVRQATPNNLKQHQYFNGLSLGVVLRR